MKFLIFNITVAAALIYLLTSDRVEIQNTAGRIHDAASEMKQVAGRVVDRGRRWVARTPTETAIGAPSPAASPANRTAKPVPMAPPARARAPMDPRPVGTEGQWRGEAVPPGPSRGAASTPRAGALAVTDPKESAAAKRREEILRGIDPAVLIPGAKPEAKTPQRTLAHAERSKRLYALSEKISAQEAAALERRKILRGIDPEVLIPKPETETARPALSPAERRKQLYALSEEMELFYARTLGQ